MKILMFTNMYPERDRPSNGVYVKRQVDAVKSLGHDIDELFVDGSGNAAMYLTGFPRLNRAVRRFKPDLIHAHYGITGFIAAFPKHVPLVVSLCGYDVLGQPSPTGGLTLKSKGIRMMTRAACTRANQIIVKSPEMGSIVEGWGFPAPHVIPNGVDVEFFTPSGERSAMFSARMRLGLDAKRRYILFPNRAWEYGKRVDLAEQVTGNVRRAGFDVELIQVYDQPQTTLLDFYHACDVMILTSESEGSPNVIKESMAAELPSVSFDIGDVGLLCDGTKCHRVVPPHDVLAMTREVIDLLSRGGQRGDGRAKIVARLSGQTVARQVEAVYHQALRH